MKRLDFGEDFAWGISTSAYQTEGACMTDGKGPSIWDEFTRPRRLCFRRRHSAHTATDFYNRYQADILLARQMNVPNFRFSISWSRLIPSGEGKVNPHGIRFYDQLIDCCLRHSITPWVTLYHWDLPLALQERGGWKNRQILSWFESYVKLCVSAFGDRVKHWMVLNEPLVFTGAGYFLGIHAPGERGLDNFLNAIHHANLCQGIGFEAIKDRCPDAKVGTSLSFSHITPASFSSKDLAAASRIDAIVNRLSLEPLIGRGYPEKNLPFSSSMGKIILPGDMERMPVDFDFIGVQTYTREVVRHSHFVPVVRARRLSPRSRRSPVTEMNWEVYPENIFKVLMMVHAYPEIRNIIVTENGAAFRDTLVNGRIADKQRIEFLRAHIAEMLRAKHAGVNVKGYFVWSLTDNFEWAEGYRPRFGLVYVDYQSQSRYIKDSGLWYSDFLQR